MQKVSKKLKTDFYRAVEIIKIIISGNTQILIRSNEKEQFYRSVKRKPAYQMHRVYIWSYKSYKIFKTLNLKMIIWLLPWKLVMQEISLYIDSWRCSLI